MEIALIFLRIFTSFLMDGIFIGNDVQKVYQLNFKCLECNEYDRIMIRNRSTATECMRTLWKCWYQFMALQLRVRQKLPTSRELFLEYTTQCWITLCRNMPCASRANKMSILFDSSLYLYQKFWIFHEYCKDTVDNKKTHPPCFSTFRFSCISPEPLQVQKVTIKRI